MAIPQPYPSLTSRNRGYCFPKEHRDDVPERHQDNVARDNVERDDAAKSLLRQPQPYPNPPQMSCIWGGRLLHG